MAYRRADHERWQQMDFVLGIKIELSNQHPVTDICDFVQGDYPKDFVFDGWHPQCFCYATPILISEDEMAKVSEAFARGETYIPKGKPVTDTPKGFKKWVKDHKEQIQGAKNPPYWVRNNKAVVNGIWRKEESKKYNGKQGSFNWTSRQAAKDGHKAYAGYDSTVKLKKHLVVNTQNIKGILGDKSKKIGGDFFFGDEGKPNIHGGNKNCVNVCFANELRRRGVNVSATNAYIKDIAEDKYNELFRTKNGSIPEFTHITGTSEIVIYNKLKKELKPGGRYILGVNDPDKTKLYRLGEISKNELDGHVVVAEVTPKGIVAYDHQHNGYVSIKAMLNNIDLVGGIEILRIDNILINEKNNFIKELVQNRN